jgi:hypothetical protein
MIGQTTSRSAKKTPMGSRSGKVRTGPSEGRSAKKIPLAHRSGKVLNSANNKSAGNDSTIGLSVGMFMTWPMNCRSAMFTIAVGPSVGKTLSVGKGLSRLDFPQQTSSVGNTFSQPTVCRRKLLSRPTCLSGM